MSRSTTPDTSGIQYPRQRVRPLDFKTVRQEYEDIWAAALESEATIENIGRPDLFVLEANEEADDSLPVANVSLVTRIDTYHGWCSCKRFENEDICEHLCQIRQEAALGTVAVPSVRL
jgi:hypothetical protein